MDQLRQLKQWYRSLPQKEQWMVSGTAALIFVTLFYLVIWEPIHVGLQTERQKQQSQQEILIWMQQAANEVRTLRASGSRSTIRDRNKPITLVIEQAIKNAGLQSSLNKIESSGNDGARVTLNEASFNQVLVWLNTLSTYNGIQVVSANIERGKEPGRANARLSFERP
ncbi:MAG: type II secretion system protein M [Gammaproteobacteria bacterium]|nr:type II secretion system protein M [Gammaproteobacteria bacterium]NNJ51199.1 type II secretion system protein M [Gammaproteobacteria bacterium]